MPGIMVDNGDDEAFGKKIGIDRFPLIHSVESWAIHSIKGGMASGRTSLMVVIPVNHLGKRHLVMAETSLNGWMLATTVLRANHKEEVEQPGWAVLPDHVRDIILPRYAEAIRRVMPGTDQDKAKELAEMLLDALSAGTPEDLHD